MSDIKTKPIGKIKKLDKEIANVQKFKNNLITTKEKISEISVNDENNSGEQYASSKIQNDINYLTRKGLEKGNTIGRKSLKETQENFINGKQKIETFESKIKEKKKQRFKKYN